MIKGKSSFIGKVKGGYQGGTMRPGQAIVVVIAFFVSVFAMSCGNAATTGTETSVESSFPRISVIPIYKSSDFTSADTCKGCHSDIYAQWNGSMMSNCFQDPLYLAMHKEAGRETGGATDTFCAACHSPIGIFSGEVPPVDGPQVSEIAKRGVQCDFCHTVSGSTGIGNYSFISEPGRVKRAQYSDSVSPFHQTAYSELHTKADFCGMCHNLSHPGNKLAIEATYTEWKNSSFAAQGVQCQDCHMTPAPGVKKLTSAATGGPQRPMVFTHQFVGGNATSLASEDHQKLATQQLQGAASVSVVPQASSRQTGVSIDVNVANTGAGHYIPTGITEVRQMWLETVITDAGGNVLYRSGAVDENGAVDPQAKMYNTEFADADGNPTEKPWMAVSVIRDKRIPPGGSDIQKFNTAVPVDAKLPLTVVATLHYRSASSSLVEELLGKNAAVLPIVDMASAQATINLTG